ncbi:unnamed protein product [Ixodes persulcatus]
MDPRNDNTGCRSCLVHRIKIPDFIRRHWFQSACPDGVEWASRSLASPEACLGGKAWGAALQLGTCRPREVKAEKVVMESAITGPLRDLAFSTEFASDFRRFPGAHIKVLKRLTGPLERASTRLWIW